IYAKHKGKYKKLREYSYDNSGKVTAIKDYRNFATKKELKKVKKSKKKKRLKKQKKPVDIYSLTTFSYDKFERLTMQTVKDSPPAGRTGKNLKLIKERYSATYDKNSNILVENIYSAQSLGKQNISREYSYDKAGRLIKVTDTDHLRANAQQSKTYAYDPVGNRTEENVKSESKVHEQTRYAYNSLNQLTETAIVDNTTAPASGNSETVEKLIPQRAYSYDKNGNEISVKEFSTLGNGEDATAAEVIAERINTYDPANRLSSLTDTKAGKTIFAQENEYNGSGQRIKKTESLTIKAAGKSDANKVAERSYAYQAGQVLYTEDRAATSAVGSTAQLTGIPKISAFNMLGISDNIIATERKTTNSKVPLSALPSRQTGDRQDRVYYFYNKDLRASTTSIVAESGAAVKAYKYDEFGNTESFGNLDNEIAYTGGIYDKNTQ
ncbi:MAG: hypothetical protein ACRCUS_04890, partial [Anaerovoracaceae bacterium]